jgi:hypothetical protein
LETTYETEKNEAAEEARKETEKEWIERSDENREV